MRLSSKRTGFTLVEVLAAAVTGSRFAFEASSFLDDTGAPPDVGQLIIACDARGLAAGAGFDGRLEVLVGAIEADGARLPGSRRLALREAAFRNGVPVDARLLAKVRDLGGC